MNRYIAFALMSLLVVFVAQSQDDASSQGATPQTEGESQAADSVPATMSTEPALSPQAERGRYLVEGVGMCGQCHTPRNDRGQLVLAKHLQGAPVPVLTPDGYPEVWAYKAPRIAGLPQHTDDEFTTLMTSGVNRDGQGVRLPMPPFRLTEDDARAIAAYLRTLP